jgi:glutamate racemase
MSLHIGVFDSGIGGITVLRDLIQHCSAHFTYLGDTLNLPYGTKSVEQILLLSRNNALFLKKKKLDLLVVACNTASSIALEEITEILYPIPVLGVIRPVVKKLQATHEDITVFATTATVKSNAYKKIFSEIAPHLHVTQKACPLLVPFIEEGWIHHPTLLQVVREYTKEIRQQQPGTAILGCTHYPWIKSLFHLCLPEWRIEDSAENITKQVLEITNAPIKNHFTPSIDWIFTDPYCLSTFAQEQISLLTQKPDQTFLPMDMPC